MRTTKLCTFLCGVIITICSCRTGTVQDVDSNASDVLANSEEKPDSTPITINDLDYQILKYFPLTVFVPKASLKAWIDRVITGSPKEMQAVDKETTKDLLLTPVDIDLASGGLLIDFKLDFKFRKCVGRVCGWWQPVHTINKARFSLTIDNWVLHAKLDDLNVEVQDKLLKATIGNIIERDMITQMDTEINSALAKASGQNLKEKIIQRMRRPLAFLANRAKFDLDIQEDGLLIVVKGPLRSDDDSSKE